MSRQSRNQEEDTGWQHGTMIDKDRYKTRCNYYEKEMKGGGIIQLKEHLADGQYRGVSCCKHVPPKIMRLMREHLA